MFAHQPQEIEVWYVIPAIRKELAKELKSEGIAQVEIARILGLTKAAVSQYLSDKRAKNMKFPKKIQSMIKESSKKINENSQLLTSEIQKIIQEIRNTGLLCEYHKKYCETTKGCTVCIEN